MINRVKTETSIKNAKIKEVSKNKFRVYIGPYSNLKTLQKAYNGVEKLEFENIIEKIKSNRKKNRLNYDCVVPWSGGKDSSCIATKLKFEFGLNPLLVTFSPLIQNTIGRNNREELIKLGFDNFFFSPNFYFGAIF